MDMSRTISQGRLAEDIALDWLLGQGMELKARNWRSGHLEIDLILESNEFLHIVEVKSLIAPYQIAPYEQVDRKKQRNLINAARRYIAKFRVEKEVRFDIVSIVFCGRKISLEYIPEAFYPIE